MEKRSKNHVDVAKWVEKVIDSCETVDQLITAKILVNRFSDQLISKYHSDYWTTHHYDIISPLNIRVNNKKTELDKK